MSIVTSTSQVARARRSTNARAPVLCEALEARRLLTTYTYLVPTATPPHTAVYLTQGSQQGFVDVRLDSPSNPPDTTLTGNDTGTGMYIIDAGSISNFLFVDRVPAALKPGFDGSDQGIKVQGGSGGHLRIEAGDEDTLIEVVDGTVPFVKVNQFVGVTRIGSGVSDLTIRTNDVQATRFRDGPGTGAEGTDVIVPALSSGIHLSVDTGSGTFDRITLGQNNTIAHEVMVKTGAGNCIVDLQQANGDDSTTALVDFVGGQLGLGNKLIIHSVGTATLENAPGTSHTIFVDEITLTGAAANERGNLIVGDAATIGTLQVSNHGTAKIQAEATISTFTLADGGTASIEAESTIGSFTVDGSVSFTGTSAPSTVSEFIVTGDLEDATGEVDVQGNADVTALTSSRIGALNIGEGGKFTLQPRPPLPSAARLLQLRSLFIQKAPSLPEGVLDLTDNAMLIDYDPFNPFADIQAYIAHGYNGGDWDEPGINSSVAATLTNTGIGYAEATDIFGSFPATWEGQSVDNTTVLVKYTYYGDANLNGSVTLADFNALASNFGQSPRPWAQGDFNYDGFVNLQDFNRLAANFGLGGLGPGDGTEQECSEWSYQDLVDHAEAEYGIEF